MIGADADGSATEATDRDETGDADESSGGGAEETGGDGANETGSDGGSDGSRGGNDRGRGASARTPRRLTLSRTPESGGGGTLPAGSASSLIFARNAI